jgi:hypothetical protein
MCVEKVYELNCEQFVQNLVCVHFFSMLNCMPLKKNKLMLIN